MAQLAQRITQPPETATAGTSAETPEPGQKDTTGSNTAGQTGIGTKTQPTPTPTFTPHDYGVMLALLAAFVILLMSLVGRRGD